MQENNVKINVLLVIIMILVIVACLVAYIFFTQERTTEEPIEETIFSLENYPKIDGSIATIRLAEAFKANFTGTDIQNIEVNHNKTHEAYVNLINGEADLILVTYPSEDEQKLAKDNNVELEIVPIVREAFVFFVNKENPVEDLTLKQIQDIYSGKIKNWKDVGGKDSKILAYQRPENSSSQSGMLDLVMQGIKITEPIKENIEESTTNIVNVISDYDNKESAIGYSYYYYLKTIYTNDSIKLLGINGVKPTYENIKNGLYDIQTAYYAVIRKDEPTDSPARKLLEAMKSEKGQSVAKEAGYVQNY